MTTRKMKWYNISADGGNTWTTQYLTEEEAEAERKNGYIVVPERSENK